jgi:hypothetical protein
MNKQTIEKLFKIAKKLDNSGYYTEAIMLTKVAYDVSPDDIIMPNERQTINNTISDDESTEITLNNIKQQYITLANTIKSLPNEHNGDDYFGKLKQKLKMSLFETGLKLGSLMTQAGMDSDSFDKFIQEM